MIHFLDKVVRDRRRVILLAGLLGLTWGCTQRGFLTLPTQNLGNSLNSLAADEEPQLSYDGRYLVFTSNRFSNRRVFLYDLQQRRLIDLPGLNNTAVLQDQPDISADGRFIVYVSEARGKPDVYLYNRQTRQTELITGNYLGDLRQPSISGDGRFIAFQSNRTGQWNIEIYDRGPGNRSPLPLPTALPSVPGSPQP